MFEVPYFHFERVSSTNDVTKELLRKYGCVFVSSDYQYNGRGRKGRVWEGDSHKNIYLSYGINETKQKSIKNKVLYQIIGCLAVESTLKEIAPQLMIKLKYPNDVYVAYQDGQYKKISGVLSEHSYSGNICTESILGIGINVDQTEFDKSIVGKATSLRLLGFHSNIDELIDRLKYNILNYLNTDENIIFEKWKDKVNLLGKEVELVNEGTIYRVETINSDGSLRASNHNGHITINNGDSIIYEL